MIFADTLWRPRVLKCATDGWRRCPNFKHHLKYFGVAASSVALLLSLGLSVAGCAKRTQEPNVDRSEVSLKADSSFQGHLDRLKVPLVLPARGKAILVNVPAFELIAFEDAKPVLRSRVIVGTPWHPTPLRKTHTTAVRFRPTWRPTPSMIASGEYPDRRWPPGPRNPLGLAAIRLEEGLLVYLHDTNKRELFQKQKRALSHGCIRVERWDDLVAWALDLDLDMVHSFASGAETFDMPIAPIPVFLAYLTTFPDNDGKELHYEDVYGRGAQISEQAPWLKNAEDPKSKAMACDGLV